VDDFLNELFELRLAPAAARLIKPELAFHALPRSGVARGYVEKLGLGDSFGEQRRTGSKEGGRSPPAW